jgi:protein-tyrosine phosphatase
MFSIFKKNPTQYVPYHLIGTDMHNHLLPGIDDGSKTMDETISLIKQMLELGYTKIYSTPHTIADLYPNTVETITAAHQATLTELQKQNIQFSYGVSSEYMIEPELLTKIKSNQILPLHSNFLLVECSFAAPPANLLEVIYEIQLAGFQPVLAHPERYIYWIRQKEKFDELYDRGVIFQLNLLSPLGYYGAAAEQLGSYLMQKNYYKLVGTDCHRQKYIDMLKNTPCPKNLMQLIQSGQLLNAQW